MIRISALNDSSDDESQSVSRSRSTTKEAQEAAAVALYNRALTLLRQGDEHGAEATFCQLLEAPFVRDAEPPEGGEVLVEPGVVLKYSTYKNLGSMAAQKEDYTTAMRQYLQAVMVDSSDVTVWYKIGSIALKLHHYPLARHAFEQGLECQPRHWPCIDNVITVLYALNNYEACLVYISRALQRDPGYIKGISFMEKIFEEQPSLRRHMGPHFEACDNSIFTVEVDQDEADEFINEALEMRARKEALCRRADRPVLNFTRPFTAFTWQNLATCLITLYDHIASSKPPITYSCKVDLSKYTSQAALEAQQQPQPPQQTEQQPQQQQTEQKAPEQTTSPGTVTEGTTPTKTLAAPAQADQPMDTSASSVPATETQVADQPTADPPTANPPTANPSTANLPTTDPLTAYPPAINTPTTDGTGSEAVAAEGEATDRGSMAPPPGPSGDAEKEAKEDGDVSSVGMDTPGPSDVSMLSDTSMMKEPGKRGAKRKRFIADTEKRRSSRVRNTGSSGCKPIEDEVKIRDLVGSILPTSLTQVRDEEVEAESSQDGGQDPAGPEKDGAEAAPGGTDPTGALSDCPLLSTTERDDVLAFINSHQINSGIIDLLNELLIALAQRALCIWPDGLTTSYIKAYSRLHKHIILPGYLCKDVPDERIVNMGKMILVYSELKVDKWIGTRSRATPSPRRSGTNQLGANFAGDTFYADLAYIDGLSQCQDIFKDEWAPFNIRVFWMKAKFNMLDSDMQEAITSFDRTSMYLEYVEKEGGEPADIVLPHLAHDNKVTLENVKQQLESLHRCQSQDKMQTLHDSGEYEKVIQLLLETFTADPKAPKVLEMERQERHAQLLLLMESLLKVNDYKRAMIWGEVCFDEALQKYYGVLTDSGRDEWAATMTQILDTIDKCIKEDPAVISNLTSRCLVRLTQNLTSLIETAFDVAENAADMAIPTMLPWILLYRLVYHEEERGARPLGDPGADNSDAGSFTPRHEGAVSLLELTHEQLGRRSWCCNHDGSLLLFIVSEVLRESRSAEEVGAVHPQHNSLDHMLEQCFYCLYGHPNRRKAKHLHDHSSSQISLTWERAVDVFEFFKPKTMPEYDSFKTSTVSGELESLLRRIQIMVPADFKLPITVEEITTYIEGTATAPPAAPEGDPQEMRVVSELYYLLADYYFKNKEQGKAIKFYLQDLCVNPERFDSWAGMALARASRLEQKLTMSELKSAEGKNEGSIWKHAIASLRSFQRALDLDSTNSKLWIEYGSLAYQLHAHASRQLKQQPMYPLSEQALEEATSNRTEMLTIASNCYRKAGECEVDENDEEWLHHYMLGKVAEKKGSDPEEYLKHYKQALHYLHNDRARYPKKITYIYSPPHLAVETLEVFYRLHASIMKYLMKHPTDAPFSMFDEFTQEAADGPFANAREKEKKPKDRDAMADDSSNSNLMSPLPPMANTSLTSTPTPSTSGRPKKMNITRIDHTYSKQRSIDSAKSDADSSNEASRAAEAHAGTLHRQTGGTIATDHMDGMQSPIAMVAPATSAINTSTTSSTASADEVKFATPVTSFSMASILESESSPKIVSSSSKETVTIPSSGQEKGKESAAVSPDTTCLDESDLLTAQQHTDSAETSAVEQQLSTSVELLSPQTSQSVSQDSSQYKAEPMDVSIESSQLDFEESQKQLPVEKQEVVMEDKKEVPESSAAASAIDMDAKPTEVIEFSEAVQVEEIDMQEGKPAVAQASEDKLDTKIDTEDTPSQFSIPDIALGPTGTDSSSQDSTTAAELERLKSEISFLNAGSTEMTAIAIMDTSDQESVKDEKDKEGKPPTPVEVKVEPEEENKEDEEMSSQNEALEALKSELAQLSAAAGSEISAEYETPDIKVEEKSFDESQGFSIEDIKPVIEEQEQKSQDLSKNAEEGLDGVKESKAATEEVPKEPGKEEQQLPTTQTTSEPTMELGKDPKEETVSDPSTKEKEPSPSSSGQDIVKEQEQSCENIEEVKEGGKDKEEVSRQPAEKEQTKTAESEDLPMPLRTDSVSTQRESDLKKDEETRKDLGDTERSETNEDTKKTEDAERIETAKDDVSAMDTAVNSNKSETPEVSSNKEKGTDSVEDKTFSEIVPAKPEKEVDPKVMFKKIMTQCIKALNLCLSRFPHHYKSLFRLANIYYHCEEFKNYENARDLLLGNVNWQQLDHMPSPGLFQDRKSSNFFQGLWRIPIEEIDRTGSFACHMLRSLQLLFPILKSLKDSKTLFSIHTMLSRTPDAGKKYLRDSDRLELARLALEYTMEILDGLVKEKAAVKDRDERVAFLLEIFRVRNHCGVKTQQFSHNPNKVLRRAYFACMKDQVEEEPSVLEQAIRFCQQEQQKAVRSPTTPDGSRSLPSTPTLHRANPLEGFSVPAKAAPTQADSHRLAGEGSNTKPISIKGISPLPARGPLPANPKSLSKVVKPCSVRLTTPFPSKTASDAVPGPKSSNVSATGSSGQKLKKTIEGPAKKLTISNVLKKPEPKKMGTSSAAGSAGSAAKLPKKVTPASSAADSPYSIFQSVGAAALAGMSSSHAAALYAQMAHMAPETLMAQYGAAINQEAVLAQMALASSYGIPMAAMPYMFTGASLDPSLWSSLAAAQAFSETQVPAKTTPPPRQSSTVKSAATATASTAPSTSQQQKSAQKVQRAAPTAGTSEPPKKVSKMTPEPWSDTKKAPQAVHSSSSAAQPLSLTKGSDKPLSLTTKTTVSASTSSIPEGYELEPGEIIRPRPAHTNLPTKAPNLTKTPPGMKVSAKTSQLYAVRMSSALAKISQAKGPQGPAMHWSPEAPPPAKMLKKTEAQTTLSTANFDPLNLLATAAQTHKQSFQATKPSLTAPKIGPSQESPSSAAAIARMIKGPPTLKGAKARSHHKQVASSQVRTTPPQAHSSHRPAPPAYSQPMNLSSQPQKRQNIPSSKPPAASSTKMSQPVSSSLLAHHLTSRAPGTTSVVSSRPTMTTASTRPTVSTSRPAVPYARPPMVTQQQMKAISKPPALPQQPKSVKPSSISSSQAQSAAQAAHAGSAAIQQVHQGYGRGKPSYPATLAARQNDDSSDDCIIISSGQESESD